MKVNRPKSIGRGEFWDRTLTKCFLKVFLKSTRLPIENSVSIPFLRECSITLITSCVSGRGNRIGPVCVSVCVYVCQLALSQPNELMYGPGNRYTYVHMPVSQGLSLSAKGLNARVFSLPLSSAGV